MGHTFICLYHIQIHMAVADPGFPVGGHQAIGGHQPPMWVPFGKNICENERIGSCFGEGAHAAGSPPWIHQCMAQPFKTEF